MIGRWNIKIIQHERSSKIISHEKEWYALCESLATNMSALTRQAGDGEAIHARSCPPQELKIPIDESEKGGRKTR